LTGAVVIAVDAMGGDQGPAATVPAVTAFLQTHPEARVVLYGSAQALSQVRPDRAGRLTLIECAQWVASGDRPAQALRHKRDSSMWQALQAVAEGRADACVSAGDTGVLMAMGIAAVGTLQGIERPAICTLLPTVAGRVCLLDLGANVDCDAGQLHQFARMGAARLQAEGLGRPPRVALLNVGVEAGKGNRVVKAAAELLGADPALDYQGFVEGDRLLQGSVDLVVCDGFVGNVALKSIEGVARLLLERLEAALRASPAWRRLAVGPLLAAALGFLDPAQYNGASLLGLRGVVVKSHGGADRKGFGHALGTALIEACGRLPQRIATRLIDPTPPSYTS
jgi:phosphate acyltransferase